MNRTGNDSLTLLRHSWIFGFVVGILLLCVAPMVAHAQLEQFLNLLNGTPTSGIAEPTLVTEPRSPGSYTEVRIMIPHTMSDVGGGINWRIDGIAQPEYQNSRNITFTTGAVGEDRTISAVVTTSGGDTRTLRTTVVPMDLDITIEGKTMVPSFYDGRALPSKNAEVLITAIPQVGDSRSHETFSYRWQVDGDVLDNGIVKGRYQNMVRAPVSRPAIVRIEVFNDDNTLLITKVFELATYDPQFRFYEVNPLRGLSPMELSARGEIEASELIVRAEPYYFDRALLEDEHRLQWSVNGDGFTPQGDGQEAALDLRGAGSARVSASLQSVVQLLQFAEGSTQFQFRTP